MVWTSLYIIDFSKHMPEIFDWNIGIFDQKIIIGINDTLK